MRYGQAVSAWPSPDDLGAYLPPPSPAPERQAHEVAAQVAEHRAEEGLAVDDDSVRRAIVNCARDGYPWPGLLFYTAEEEAELANVSDDLLDRAQALFERSPTDLAEATWIWRDGRLAVRVMVTRDIERYRELVDEHLGAERVIVAHAHLSMQELGALQQRVIEDADQLSELGINVQWVCIVPGNRLEVEYFAVDRGLSLSLLRDRFGPSLKPVWIAPERLGEEPQPFASWTTNRNELTVFYPLEQNGEEPGRCTAEEHPDRVVVRLTIRAPQGIATLVGGFKRSHATVGLAEPLGDRAVIDGATGAARPKWEGHRRA